MFLVIQITLIYYNQQKRIMVPATRKKMWNEVDSIYVVEDA